jgi:hypothetical protein
MGKEGNGEMGKWGNGERGKWGKREWGIPYSLLPTPYSLNKNLLANSRN